VDSAPHGAGDRFFHGVATPGQSAGCDEVIDGLFLNSDFPEKQQDGLGNRGFGISGGGLVHAAILYDHL